ncbi:hypothetical protein PBRA_009280 [Plasmodiophora brassicae]|nr:hypothetical protein PBRA_009280 [Plasmodiophora brassicae]
MLSPKTFPNSAASCPYDDLVLNWALDQPHDIPSFNVFDDDDDPLARNDARPLDLVVEQAPSRRGDVERRLALYEAAQRMRVPVVPVPADMERVLIRTGQATTMAQRMPTNPRYNTKVACVHCARHKLGCDYNRPCKRCVDTGKEKTCIDRDHSRRRRPPSNRKPYAVIRPRTMPSSAAAQLAQHLPPPPLSATLDLDAFDVLASDPLL